MSNKIKLIQLAKKINVGIDTLGETLKSNGVEQKIDANTRITKEDYEILVKEHCKGMSSINLEELSNSFWTSKSNVKNPKPTADVKDKNKEKPKVEEIKTEIPIELKPKLNIKGNINKNLKDKNTSINKSEGKKEISINTSKSHNSKLDEKELNTIKEIKSTNIVLSEDKKEKKIHNRASKSEKVKSSNEKISKEKSNNEIGSISAISKLDNITDIDNELQSKDTTSKEKMSSEIKDSDLLKLHNSEDGPAIKVVGKIDLSKINDSTRPQKKSTKKDGKRKRIKGSAVDIKAEAAKAAERQKKKNSDYSSKGISSNTMNNQQTSKRKKKSKAQNNKPQITEEDVQKQVKETLARLTGKKQQSGKSAKYRKDKRVAARNAALDALEESELDSKTLKLTEFVTASDLANMMDIPVNQIIATCMSIGLMVSINMRLEAETIELIADEFGFRTEFVSAEVVEAIPTEDEEDRDEDLESRPPIVTVMGHVDHGKTSLLDRLRHSNVIEDEAGGITQHIGAYSLKLDGGRRITFLDTPGHEAFTAMRARGAKITDIAIIIVAADDDVMPQTKEAINHATAAGVPIVFAINKIDKPHANPDKIREQLAAMNYLVEEWGGKYQCQEISAKQGINIDKLLEKVLLEAEILELKANPTKRASGSIIESSLDKGRGYIATIMVQNGILKMGDIVLSGINYGRIKAMFNERNQRVEQAGPATPVLILGLDGAPTAGESFVVMDNDQDARNIANKREQLKREQDNRTKKGLTLDELARRKALGNFQELNLIIKGDVDGSIEALSDSLIRLSTEEIQVNVLHKGVGQISESDVVLASASSAIIIGFQVRPSQAAKRMADRDGVEIRTYSIIYNTIEDIKSAMEGMLSPEIKENITANLEVLQVFKVSSVGTVAGCMVVEGKIKRTNKIRLIRDGIVKYQGELGSLKRYKDDVKEVPMGLECGLNIEGYNDIKEGDMIEAFEEVEVKKTL